MVYESSYALEFTSRADSLRDAQSTLVEPIAWISCSFLYRVRPFSALHEQPHAVACLEYAVIGTLEVLLLCLCHLRRRYSAHRRVISKVDEYHQTDRTAEISSSFKNGVRMFRNHRNIRTYSRLLVERYSRATTKVVEPIAWISCFFLYCVRLFSALHEQPHTVACLEYAVIGTLEKLLHSPYHI